MPTVPPRGADLEKQVCRAWVPRLHISTQPLLYGKEFPCCPKEEATMETEEKIIMFVLCAVTPNIVPFSNSYGTWRQHMNQIHLGIRPKNACWTTGKKQCVRAGVANKPYIISVDLLQYNFVKKDLATLATCLCSRRPWCQHTCKLNATQLPLTGTRWPLACG